MTTTNPTLAKALFDREIGDELAIGSGTTYSVLRHKYYLNQVKRRQRQHLYLLLTMGKELEAFCCDTHDAFVDADNRSTAHGNKIFFFGMTDEEIASLTESGKE